MLNIGQSETCILAAMMINPNCLQESRYELRPGDFVNQKNREIYEAILALDNDGIPILPTSILDRLSTYNSKVDETFIGDILVNVQTSLGFEYHIKRIKENRVKRALMELSSRIEDNATRMNAAELLAYVNSELSGIHPPAVSQSIVNLSDVLPDVVESIGHHDSHAIPTGIAKLDDMIDGWHPGDLIILAGRPGFGKSILAKDFAESSGVPVLYFSLEMPVDQLVKRQLSRHSGINYTSIRKAQVPDQDWHRIISAANKLDNFQIAYSDKANMSISELVSTCDSYRSKHPLGLVIIDYLQLIRADGKLEHREREVSQISQRLKTMARDFNIPVICLAQLNRACEIRGGDKKPMLSDLRESGSIEQDADTVIFIWRESMYVRKRHEDGTTNEHEAMLIVAKGRNSGTGAVKVFFDGAHQRFGNLQQENL
jgi:replicative DNA helicase